MDEFVKVTGYHRKAAIRLLLKVPKPKDKPAGRPGTYNGVLEPLKAIWKLLIGYALSGYTLSCQR